MPRRSSVRRRCSTFFSCSNFGEWTPITTSSSRYFRSRYAEVRHQVQAVDAAVGPEVEQHDLAAQLAQRQRPARVQPRGGAAQLGRVNRLDRGVGRDVGQARRTCKALGLVGVRPVSTARRRRKAARSAASGRDQQVAERKRQTPRPVAAADGAGHVDPIAPAEDVLERQEHQVGAGPIDRGQQRVAQPRRRTATSVEKPAPARSGTFSTSARSSIGAASHHSARLSVSCVPVVVTDSAA